METTHHPSTGGSHSFTVTSAAPAPPAISSLTYSIPPPPLRPADAWYDRAVPAEVPAVYTSSGHTLVEVVIDGRRAGLMLLDTGELQAGPSHVKQVPRACGHPVHACRPPGLADWAHAAGHRSAACKLCVRVALRLCLVGLRLASCTLQAGAKLLAGVQGAHAQSISTFRAASAGSIEAFRAHRKPQIRANGLLLCQVHFGPPSALQAALLTAHGTCAGASGGVIEKSVADELGLAGFGELYVAGMSGTVRSHFPCLCHRC